MAYSNAQIRRLEPSEWELYRAVRLAALLDAPTAFGSTFAASMDFDQEQWTARITNAPTFIAVVPQGYSELPLGIASYWSEPIEGSGSAGPGPWTTSGELIGMWASPVARGSHIGADLVESVVNYGAAQGNSEMFLHVYADNPAAVRFYEKCGFARISSQVEDRRGQEIEMLKMVRALV